MKKICLILFLVTILTRISAQIYLNIYIDEAGSAKFLGDSDLKNLTFPGGIDSENGIVGGTTDALTSKNGEIWTFAYSLENSYLNVILPEGTKVKNLSEGEIYLNGKQIAVYNPEKIEVSYTIEEVKNYGYLTYLTILFIILILLFLYYKKFMKKKKENLNKPKKKQKKIDKFEILKQTLHERQNKIIDKLKEVGEIKQSRLQKLVEIPKASFSRHLQELGKKGIIERIGEGKNKMISLR